MSSTSIPDANFISHFETLQMSQKVSPPQDTKLYFIFGASEAGIKNRIEFLKEALGDNISSKDIVFLGGDRKLSSNPLNSLA